MLEQIRVQGIHYNISDTTLSFIQEKLSKIDFMDAIIVDGDIRITRESEHYKVDAKIHLNNKQQIHVNTTHDQLYPAIETLMHKLRHLLSEEHKKLTSHHEHHAPSVHHGDGHPTSSQE